MNAVRMLTNDHRTVEELFSSFHRKRAAESQRQVAQEIVKELSIHSAIEEAIFYPAVRESVPEGDPLVEHSLHEHHEIKEALSKVDDSMDKAGTTTFAKLVDKLQEVVDEHVGEEESEVFPAVKEAMNEKRLNELGSKMSEEKKVAPTRPHLLAPDEGAAAALVGKAAGVFDRARDKAAGRS